jgi:hypothetical protein
LALSLDYALQLLLFCPVMLWSAHFERFEEEKEEAEESGRQNGKVVMAETSWSVVDEPTKARRKYSPSKMEKEEGGKVTFLAKLLNSYCGLLSNRQENMGISSIPKIIASLQEICTAHTRRTRPLLGRRHPRHGTNRNAAGH